MYGTESNAFETSVQIKSKAFPSSIKALQSSIAVSKLVMQFLLGTKPCYSSANRLFLVKCSIMNTLMINSNSLYKADVILLLPFCVLQ